jgi:hypothetical protein
MAGMRLLLTKGREGYTRCASDFLKLRYAYQVVRLAHYVGDYEECVALYDELVPPLHHVESTIRYWTLEHKAGALRRIGKVAESLYLFSRVFDVAPERHNAVLQSFRFIPADDETWQTCLGLAENAQEQIMLWKLRWAARVRAPFPHQIEPLQAIYELESASPVLETMLVERIHEIERVAVSPYLPQYFDLPLATKKPEKPHLLKSFWQRLWGGTHRKRKPARMPRTLESALHARAKKPIEDPETISQLKQFVLHCVTSGQVRQPALWYPSAAYLSFMEGEYDEALAYLEKAQTQPVADQHILHQARLIECLVELYRMKTIAADFEQRIYPELQWLIAQTQGMQINSVMTSLAQKYLLQDDVPKAILCFLKAGDVVAANVLLDVYAAPEDLEALSMLLAQTDPPEFEAWLVKDFPLTQYELADLLGTRLLRRHQFGDAFAIFQTLPEDYWTQAKDCKEAGSPHYGYGTYLASSQIPKGGQPYWGSPYCQQGQPENKVFATSFSNNWYYTAGDVEKLNKFTFTRKILELEEQAQQTRKHAAQYYWQIANAFYNTPYWGYSGIVWWGELVDTFNWYYDPGGYPFNVQGIAETMYYRKQDFLDEYGNLSIALEYYEKALKASKDKELAAQAALMAYRCNNKALASLHDLYYERALEQQDTTYLQVLQKKYADSAFYKQMIKECPTVKHFSQ